MKRICLFVFLCGMVSAAEIPMKNRDAPSEIKKNKRYKREENGEDWLLERIEVSWPKGYSSENAAEPAHDEQPSNPSLYMSQEDQTIYTDRPNLGGGQPKQPNYGGGNGNELIQPNRLIIPPKPASHIGRIKEGGGSSEIFINEASSESDLNWSQIYMDSSDGETEGKEDKGRIGVAAKNEQIDWEKEARDIAWTFGIPKDSIKMSDILLAREGTGGDDSITDWKKVSWSKDE